MQGEPAKRRYPKFQIRAGYIGAIIAAFLLDYMHPEMHFMVALGVCMLSIATEAGLVLAKGRRPSGRLGPTPTRKIAHGFLETGHLSAIVRSDLPKAAFKGKTNYKTARKSVENSYSKSEP